MLHGRAGAYSSAAGGVYAAGTLSQRHVQWGAWWAQQGYVALHVDSFGPRGHAAGFSVNSYRDRPAAVSEQTVRPLDALGALDYLRRRGDVSADRIGIFGWSNGAMAVLATFGRAANAGGGFRAAIALYPGCGAQDRNGFQPNAPLLLLLAGSDEEVSPHICERLAKRLQSAATVDYVMYARAQHAFDDPGAARRAHAANRAASDDAQRRAQQFFARHLAAESVRP
jgi:carboxymethylenebutenolidase